MHERYEQLCALAVTGQITGDAMSVLDAHVKECAECRVFLEDLMPIKAQVAPVVAGSHARTFEPPEGMRERFLQRASDAGLQLKSETVMAVPESLEETLTLPRTNRGIDRRLTIAEGLRAWCHSAFRVAVPVAAAVLFGTFGFLLAQHRYKNVTAPITIVQAPAVAASTSNSEEIARLQAEGKNARQRLEAVEAELSSAQSEKTALLKQLSALAEHASAGDRFELQFRAATHKLQEADGRISQLRADLDAERNRAATSDAILVAQQKAAAEANSKVAALEAKLDQRQEFESSKGLAGELLAARNLHIVDVYDSETSGQRRRAFGRVFYVEGRSLVFYAYDLPSSKNNRKIEFRVWGEQAGTKSVSISLGAMRNDNGSQGRWVLACNDAKILSRINAIYITSDPGTRPSSEPRGSKMMYAFLGTPNHP